jgi:hypothetical protein
MTAPDYPQTPVAQQAKKPKGKGLGIAALVLGIISLVFCWIPLLNILFIICGFVALGLGIAGVFFSHRVLSAIGAVLGLLGIIFGFVVNGAFVSSVNDQLNNQAPVSNGDQPQHAPAANQPQDKQAPVQHTVVYKVTGSDTAASITWTTDGMTSTSSASNVSLPWSKTIELPTGKSFQMVQLMAQGGSTSSNITETITVDGKVIKKSTATGYGVASANANIGSLGG